MLMRAIINPETQALCMVSVQFDPWEEFVSEKQAWPGLGKVLVGFWYACDPPPEILESMSECGKLLTFTLFRRPIDSEREQAWKAGKQEQVSSLDA
jgi:hypothetical protein